jgi:RNA polymerase sigma-70 factor (ECF subfamily)
LLLRALRSIPLELQLLLQLHYWDEVPTAEIGEILGIPAGTVKSRLFRARGAVKESITHLESNVAMSESTMSNLDAWARSLRDAFDAGE